MKSLRAVALAGLFLAVPAWSADAQLHIEIPPHGARPYVAVWLENASDHAFAGNVAVWYDQYKRNNRGARWLRDLREWWRQIGSGLDLPIDGVSGATRAAGGQAIDLGASRSFAGLAPGAYNVVIEAAREHGGHELLRLPLQWPPRGVQHAEARGAQEIGLVRLTVKP